MFIMCFISVEFLRELSALFCGSFVPYVGQKTFFFMGLLNIVNFGLLILVWMVQLIVYPSMTHMSEKALLEWHSKYTFRVSLLVIPLMFGQLGLLIYYLKMSFSYSLAIALFLVFGAWLNTFLQAVPLHNKIAANTTVNIAAHSLVKVNWIRTILWTIVFILIYFF